MPQTLVALFLEPAKARKAAQELRTIGVGEQHLEVLDAYVSDVNQRLERMGVPRHDRGVYGEGVRRGGALVMATVHEKIAEQASTLMDSFGAVDIDDFEREIQQTEPALAVDPIEAQPAPDAPLEPLVEPGQGALDASPSDTELLVPQEDLELPGGIQVRATLVESPVEQVVSAVEEEWDVERRAADRTPAAGELASFEDGVMELIEMGEDLVVSKRVRVVEELVIKKRVREREEVVTQSLKQTQVTVVPSRRAAH